MPWMKMLCQTYDNNSALAGKSSEEFASLSLVAHMVANAQLEITINEQGEFVGAKELTKDENKTIIPVTEKSSARSSGTAPHPLCDTLSYIAGDFSEFLGTEKEKKKASEKYTAYSEALKKWSESENTHPKVKAVYAYISRAELMSDLIKCDIAKLNDDGILDSKKIQGSPYDKMLVRFRVVTSSSEYASNAVWEDSTLFDSFTRYYLSTQEGKKDICYIYGRPETSCVIHPKGIVASNYGAKLISSNDKECFTFRGRFVTSDEAYSVSYEATQKAHNALTWLAKNQGVPIGNKEKRTYICWNPKGKPVPSIDDPDSFGDEENETYIDRPLTEPMYRKRLEKAFKGYSDALDENDDIVLIALDAATTGRLSITYYNELM